MKFIRYTNVLRDDLGELNQEVNNLISKGCSPIGGLGLIHIGQKLFYYQTIVVEDENHDVLGYYIENKEPDYLEEVRRLVKERKLFEAVKLYKDKVGIGLAEAKAWVETNCF